MGKTKRLESLTRGATVDPDSRARRPAAPRAAECRA